MKRYLIEGTLRVVAPMPSPETITSISDNTKWTGGSLTGGIA